MTDDNVAKGLYGHLSETANAEAISETPAAEGQGVYGHLSNPAANADAPRAKETVGEKIDDKQVAKPQDEAEVATDDDEVTVLEDPADIFYRESALKERGRAIQTGVETLATKFNLSPEQALEHRTAAAKLFHELGGDVRTTDAMYSKYVDALVNPPSDEQVETWGSETVSRLQQKYGDEANEHLKLAQLYIAGKPELRATLEATGLGNNPDIVLELVDRIEQLKRSGKIKRTSKKTK